MNIPSLGVGGVRVFKARQRVGWQAAGFIAGGIVFFLVLMLQFLLALGRKTTPANDMMPGIIGGLSVFGIALIARGVFLLRGVTRVVLDDGGVQVEGFIARRQVSYQQIEQVERDKRIQLFAGKTNEVLLLRAAGEKQPLAIIPDTIDRFEELAAELAWRTAAAQGGRTTYDPVADQQTRQTREGKRLKLVSVCFSIFTLMFVAAFCYGIYEEVHSRWLASSGTRVEAAIGQHFMRRVTPYIAYTFRDGRGVAHLNEVMVTQELYDATEGAKTVPVVYLADDPEWNRLVDGGAGKTFGGSSLFLFGGGMLMFGALAVMTLMGIDIKSENGRTMIVKRGKVIREFGPKPTTPPALPPMPSFDAGQGTAATLAAASDEDEEESAGGAADDAAIRRSVEWYKANAAAQAAAASVAPAAPGPAKGLIVLGVLCLIFGLLGVGLSVVRWAMNDVVQSRPTRIGNQQIVADQPSYAPYWSLADAALAAALTVTGIGLLAGQRWSRGLGIPVAVLQILSTVGAVALVIVSMSRQPETNGPDSMTIVTINIASIVFKLLTAVFPAVLLFILMKRSTREALGAGKPLP